jgi:hypothetical protein
LRKDVDELTSGKLQTNSQIVAPVIKADSQIVAPVINATNVITNEMVINRNADIFGLLTTNGSLKIKQNMEYVNLGDEVIYSSFVQGQNAFITDIPEIFNNSLIYLKIKSLINNYGYRVVYFDNITRKSLFTLSRNADGRASTIFNLMIVPENKTIDPLFNLCEGNYVDCDSNEPDLLVQDDIESGGSIFSNENMTAQHFVGDGSQLTGIGSDNSSWNESYANTKYLGADSINTSCPAGYLLSGHIVNSSGVFNNCSIKDLNYHKKLASFSGKVGSGSGEEDNFYMGNWNIIPYEAISDPGNNWDNAEYWYVIPYNGTYSASYFVRTTDGTPIFTGYAITLNIEGTSEDNPDFTKWTAVTNNVRSSDGRTILGYHFTEGQKVRVLIYQDETDTYSCSDASFQIELSSLD